MSPSSSSMWTPAAGACSSRGGASSHRVERRSSRPARAGSRTRARRRDTNPSGAVATLSDLVADFSRQLAQALKETTPPPGQPRFPSERPSGAGMIHSHTNVRRNSAHWSMLPAVLLLTWTTALGQLPLPKVAAAAGLPGISAETNSSARAGEPDATANTLEVRLAEARANLAAAESLGDAALTNAPVGVSFQDVAARRALLQRLVRLLEQQLSNVSELEYGQKSPGGSGSPGAGLDPIHRSPRPTRFCSPTGFARRSRRSS